MRGNPFYREIPRPRITYTQWLNAEGKLEGDVTVSKLGGHLSPYLDLSLYIYVCMYVYIYIYIHTYIHIYTFIYIYIGI